MFIFHVIFIYHIQAIQYEQLVTGKLFGDLKPVAFARVLGGLFLTDVHISFAYMLSVLE